MSGNSPQIPGSPPSKHLTCTPVTHHFLTGSRKGPSAGTNHGFALKRTPRRRWASRRQPCACVPRAWSRLRPPQSRRGSASSFPARPISYFPRLLVSYGSFQWGTGFLNQGGPGPRKPGGEWVPIPAPRVEQCECPEASSLARLPRTSVHKRQPHGCPRVKN